MKRVSVLQVAYKGLWQRAIMPVVQANKTVSLRDIVEATGIKKDDVEQTLKDLKLVHYYKGGWSLVSLGDKDVTAIMDRIRKPCIGIDRSRLHWLPYAQQVVQTGSKR